MKKILSTFLLSAMLVLVLGACADGHTHVYPEQHGLESKEMAEAKETQREENQQRQIERLENQIETLIIEMRYIYDGKSDSFGWEYSPFRDYWTHSEWVGDDYEAMRCDHCGY